MRGGERKSTVRAPLTAAASAYVLRERGRVRHVYAKCVALALAIYHARRTLYKRRRVQGAVE